MSTATTSPYEVGQTYHVPPAELVLHRNIRSVSATDPDLVASVREHGVVQPIVAVLDEQGRLVVRFGHRRTLAAVEAAQPTVPVYVRSADDLTRTAEVERILSQHDENTNRAGLAAADELEMVDQLVAFGFTVEEIASQLRMAEDRAARIMAVGASPLTRKAAHRPTLEGLTIDQLAAVADFEDDPDTASKLLTVAASRPDQFAHVLQRELDDRTREQVRVEKVLELEADGITVVTLADGRLPDGAMSLQRLRDQETGKEVTARGHKKCPGNAAYVRIEPTVVNGERRMVGHTEWICTAALTYHRDALAAVYGNPAGRVAQDETDAQREERLAARRLVIENNKAWDAAEPVRREWLTALTHRKSAPKGWAAFVVASLADRHVRWLLHEQAGLEVGAQLGAATSVEADKDGPLATLVWVLAAYEGALTRDSWREDGKTSPAGRYLKFLDSIGYPLSDVELYALSSRTA